MMEMQGKHLNITHDPDLDLFILFHGDKEIDRDDDMQKLANRSWAMNPNVVTTAGAALLAHNG